jgi:hypothetical protein
MPENEDIPEEGLAEVLRGWSGRGQLHEALAAAGGDLNEMRWHPRDIEGRAHRILLAELHPLLERWPVSAVEWLHALPAQSVRQRRITMGPGPGTDWVETRLLGWPPEHFVTKDRSRVADQIMSGTLRWVLDNIARVRRDAVRIERSLQGLAATQLAAALSLRTKPPLNATEAAPPTPADVRALRRSGRPWTRLAPVADCLRAFGKTDLMSYARQHLMPDEDLRPRLFHLAVFGMLLKTLRERGAAISSLRPLSGSLFPGPAYEISLNGTTWDLWFEAAAMWGYYNLPSPYQELMAPALGHSATPLGADILLVAPGGVAHAFECKFGQTSYIARSGYLQACTYGLELGRYPARRVTAHVVAPDSKVLSDHELQWNGVTVGVLGPRHLRTFGLDVG